MVQLEKIVNWSLPQVAAIKKQERDHSADPLTCFREETGRSIFTGAYAALHLTFLVGTAYLATKFMIDGNHEFSAAMVGCVAVYNKILGDMAYSLAVDTQQRAHFSSVDNQYFGRK